MKIYFVWTTSHRTVDWLFWAIHAWNVISWRSVEQWVILTHWKMSTVLIESTTKTTVQRKLTNYSYFKVLCLPNLCVSKGTNKNTCTLLESIWGCKLQLNNRCNYNKDRMSHSLQYKYNTMNVAFIHERRDGAVWFHHVVYETFQSSLKCLAFFTPPITNI